MIASNAITLILAIAGMASTATIEKREVRQKANEYKDDNCQSASYGHNSFSLTDVTMDDTSNSVYLTIGEIPNGGAGKSVHLYAFDGKSGNGGHCTGHQLGEITASGFCANLNTFYPGSRIRCVRFARE